VNPSEDPPRTWESVSRFLEQLPGAVPDPPGGREVIRVAGKVVAYPSRGSRGRPEGAGEDEEFLVVKVSPAERESLLQEDPATFFVTPHYQAYPGVIIRLATVDPAQLRELLIDAWRLAAPKRLAQQLPDGKPGRRPGSSPARRGG
jgi:hypothetical protein